MVYPLNGHPSSNRGQRKASNYFDERIVFEIKNIINFCNNHTICCQRVLEEEEKENKNQKKRTKKER